MLTNSIKTIFAEPDCQTWCRDCILLNKSLRLLQNSIGACGLVLFVLFRPEDKENTSAAVGKSLTTGSARMVFETGLESCLSLSFWVKENKGSVCWRDLPRQISESRLSPPPALWLLRDRPQKSSLFSLPSAIDIYEELNCTEIWSNMLEAWLSFQKRKKEKIKTFSFIKMLD